MICLAGSIDLFSYYKTLHISSQSSLRLFLFLVTHESSQLSYLRVHLLVEVEAVFLAVSNLQKIVVEGLLGDAHFLGGCLKRFLNVVSKLIVKPRVKLSPQGHLLDHLANLLLLVFAVDIVLVVFYALFLD